MPCVVLYAPPPASNVVIDVCPDKDRIILRRPCLDPGFKHWAMICYARASPIASLENLLNAAFVSAARCSISQWPVSAKVIDVTSGTFLLSSADDRFEYIVKIEETRGQLQTIRYLSTLRSKVR